MEPIRQTFAARWFVVALLFCAASLLSVCDTIQSLQGRLNRSAMMPAPEAPAQMEAEVAPAPEPQPEAAMPPAMMMGPKMAMKTAPPKPQPKKPAPPKEAEK